jgi:pimeloyl-ACP methyl ester carboxylesterase
MRGLIRAMAAQASSTREGYPMNAKLLSIESMTLSYLDTGGSGSPIVLVHGNSGSSLTFRRQLEGPLARGHRLIAVDLPGHGGSARADSGGDGVYSLRGFAAVLRRFVERLALTDVTYVGHSLGGHLLLEADPLPGARQILIFGTPPLRHPASASPDAFLAGEALPLFASAELDEAAARRMAAACFARGATVEDQTVADIRRTDPRVRPSLFASMMGGAYRDEVEVLERTPMPVAILHGAGDQLVNLAYLQTLRLPTLWRGAVQIIEGAGHSPHLESPAVFDRLLGELVESPQAAGRGPTPNRAR